MSHHETSIQTVIDYVRGLAYQDVPPAIVQKAKDVILDEIGVILAASRYPAGKIATEIAREQGGSPQSSVMGADLKTSMVNAALANGIMGHDMELDESFTGGLHAAAVIVPAAFAVAEAQKCDDKTLILSVLAAFDMTGRLFRAMDYRWQMERGFHSTCTIGTITAAVAAGKLFGLDQAQFTSALGLAGSQACGLMGILAEKEHFAKSFQTGIPARNGVTAALFARKGYLGPPDVFEGRYNLIEAFTGRRNFAPLTEELGQRFDITQAAIKLYASCRWTHGTLDAFFDIVKTNTVRAEDIASIDIRIAHAGVPVIDNNPLLTHNMQFVVSTVANYGAITRDDYTERRSDPRVWDLARRITVTGDDELEKLYPQIRPTIIKVVMNGGQVFEKRVEYPRGASANPLTPEELITKFKGLAVPVVGEKKANELIRLGRKLEELEDVSILGDLVRTA
jgi:2-methylcitrate dehydratase PrpD